VVEKLKEKEKKVEEEVGAGRIWPGAAAHYRRRRPWWPPPLTPPRREKEGEREKEELATGSKLDSVRRHCSVPGNGELSLATLSRRRLKTGKGEGREWVRVWRVASAGLLFGRD